MNFSKFFFSISKIKISPEVFFSQRVEMWSTMKEVRPEPPFGAGGTIISSYDAKMLEIPHNPPKITLQEHVWGVFSVEQGERLNK